MAVNTNPLFGGIPITNIANVSVANTGTTEVPAPVDATNFRLLFTAGVNGGYVDAIDYQAIGTGTPGASIMNIWITDTGGTYARVNFSITVAAGSAMSTTVKGVYLSTVMNFMNLAPGQAVYATFTVLAANVTYNVSAYGGQYQSQ